MVPYCISPFMKGIKNFSMPSMSWSIMIALMAAKCGLKFNLEFFGKYLKNKSSKN